MLCYTKMITTHGSLIDYSGGGTIGDTSYTRTGTNSQSTNITYVATADRSYKTKYRHAMLKTDNR